MHHVLEHHPVPRLQGAVEAVVPDHVPRQAGVARQAAGVRPLPRLPGTANLRPVGHLQDVGHVVGRGGVEYRDVDVVVHDIEHGRDQAARPPCHGGPRLQVDVDPVAPAEIANQPDQALQVVAFAGHQVAATEVHPPHAGNPAAEALLERRQGPLQAVGPRLAEDVEVQPLDPLERTLLEGRRRHPEARPASAGVVQGRRHLVHLGVDANAAGDARRQGPVAKTGPLGERVEAEVVRETQEPGHIRVRVGRRVDVEFPPEGLVGQARLVERTGRTAGQELADEREDAPQGKPLERQQDTGAGRGLDLPHDRQVVAQPRLFQQVAGGRQAVDVGFRHRPA